MRMRRITDAVPTRAALNRHPNDVGPNSHSPKEIMYLPTIGWTTASAFSVSPLKSPWANACLSPVHVPPYPSLRNE